MKKGLHLFGVLLTAFFTVNSVAQTTTRFNDGYLTVFKVTSGSTLANTGTAVIMEEYNTTTASQTSANYSVSLPTTSGNKLVVSGTASSSGGITRSENGRFIVIPGYDGLVGDLNSTFTTNGALRTVDGAGIIGTGISAGGTQWLSSNNGLRSGTTDDGTNYWISGNGVGIQTSTNGSTVTTISTTSTNNRDVYIYNGQLYLTTGAGTKGIYTVGSGKPTTGGQTATLLFTPTNTDPYAFSLSPDGTTLYYVAASSGGIYRSTFDGSTWTGGTQIFSGTNYTGLAVDWSNYTFSTSAANGARIYASNPSTIIAADDNGINTLVTTTLRTEPTPANNAFRQLAFSPIKQTVSIGANTPATGTVLPGGTDVALYQFNLNAEEGNSTLKKVVITQSGTATLGSGNDINNFRLVEDVNSNGIAELSELSSVLATGTINGTAITFNSISLANYITESSSKNFIVVGDISANATGNNTFIPTISTNKVLNSTNYTTHISNAGGSWVYVGNNGATGNTLTIFSATPAITVTTTNFNGAFGNITVNTSSVSSPFIVSGSNLTANLVITPPSGFEIRTGSNAFSSNAITLVPSGGTVSNTIIDVRFSPTSVMAYSGNITCMSTGATTQNVAVSGTGVAATVPTKLAITAITPASPYQNTAFSITVESQDANNTPQNVVNNTNVSISLMTGNGALSGTLTGTINAGSSSVTISGVLYNMAETGIAVMANRTSGDVLTDGHSSAFNVLGVATQLAFVGVPSTGIISTNLVSFSVEARKDDNTVDVTYTGSITLAKESGPGSISGTLSVNAVAGIATFNAVQFDTPGIVTIKASASGLVNDTSISITISATSTPSLTDVIVPKYMEGNSPSNTTRLPFVYRVTLNNLTPNATYRYFNQAATSADPLTTSGAGNSIYAIAGAFKRSTSPGLSTAGTYNTFTTDNSGSYTGWFIFEPTGNTRFTPGNHVFMRIMLNNGAGGTTVATRLTTTDSVKVLDFSANAGSGTGLSGTSSAAPRNFVFAYDNVNGTGRPVSGTYVETDSVANITGTYVSFYANTVDGVNGAYGVIIPNTNANGIQRIEQRDFATAAIVGCPATDTDGIWPTGANTVNPTGGPTALVLTPNDALLDPNTTSSIGGVVTSADSVCSGSNSDTLTLSGNIGSIIKWQYSSDNFSSDVQDITNTTSTFVYTNLVQTTYYRAVVQNGSCASANSSNVTITVLASPTVSFSAFTSPVCDSDPALSLTGGSPAGGVYSGTGVSSGMFIPAVSGAGAFVISYTVSNSLCSASDTASIIVSLCTGISTNETDIITVYPNPSNGIVNIVWSNTNSDALTISVTDIMGREVHKELYNATKSTSIKEINLEKQPKGIYYMKLQTNGANDAVRTYKLIIQ